MAYRLRSFRPRAEAAAYERAFKIYELTNASRCFPEYWMKIENVDAMVGLGEADFPEEYERTTKRRNELWAFLLRSKGKAE